MNFRANCNCRASWVMSVIPMVLVSVGPKLFVPQRFDPDDPQLWLGAPKLGWLVELRKSARNCKLFDSVIRKFFCKLMSASKYPGPMTGPCAGQSPKPEAGCENAVGLNHCFPSPPTSTLGYDTGPSQSGRGEGLPVPELSEA